jgi:hypothetical protein
VRAACSPRSGNWSNGDLGDRYAAAVNGSRVPLPPEVDPPFEVYVNGLPQAEGTDFVLDGRDLVFARELTAPARDTARSLVRGFFFGRYRPEHVVDVAYQAGGRGHVVSGLPIQPLK